MANAQKRVGVLPQSHRLIVPVEVPSFRARRFWLHPRFFSSFRIATAAREAGADFGSAVTIMSAEILSIGSTVNRKELDDDAWAFADGEVGTAKHRKSLARERKLTPMGVRILAALERSHMTQNELERLLFPDDPHHGRGRVSRYMSGERGQRSLDVQLFKRMAKFLNVNFGWLVVGEGDMDPPPEPVFATHVRKT